jgi:hypothetical protein
MAHAFRPKTILPIALAACALSLYAPAAGKTLERFNLSAGAGGTLSDPGFWIGKELGTGFVFLGPGVDLFENRFSLQLDLGVSDAMFNSYTDEYLFSRYQPERDTLFLTESEYAYREDETIGMVSYTGALNFDNWSFYAGSLVLMRLIEVERTGTEYRSFALGDSLDRFESLDQKPIEERFRLGNGSVLALYGAARRFGRISVFIQGVAMVSLQAGIRVSLRPLGKVGPHAGR